MEKKNGYLFNPKRDLKQIRQLVNSLLFYGLFPYKKCKGQKGKQ